MSSLNTKKEKKLNHEGGTSGRFTAYEELRRAVLSCMLWEDSFYESGKDIALRIEELVAKVDPTLVKDLAVEARHNFNLRHVPLLLIRELSRKGENVKEVIPAVINRADEMAELLAIYWKDGKIPIPNSMKKGLAQAFIGFDEYQLAKYNRKGRSIDLRDVLFLCHARPKDDTQAALWKRLVDGKLETPDTWEVSLSQGGDKKEKWERLLREKKLGALAFLRNLRNMENCSVKREMIIDYMQGLNISKVMPFRFISAAKYAPSLESEIERLFLRKYQSMDKIKKRVALLIDVSWSMNDKVSGKSDITRMDAACGLAMCFKEVYSDVRVFSFSERVVEVPSRRGFALRDVIRSSQPHSGTRLGAAVREISSISDSFDELIVFTDEQSRDLVPDPKDMSGTMINVASYDRGVSRGAWQKIDGFSEAIVDWKLEIDR